jgi:hypothetical protein
MKYLVAVLLVFCMIGTAEARCVGRKASCRAHRPFRLFQRCHVQPVCQPVCGCEVAKKAPMEPPTEAPKEAKQKAATPKPVAPKTDPEEIPTPKPDTK